MDKEEKQKRHLIKKTLAEHLGVEIDDINEEDNLKEDLHMNPVDLTDFSQKLSSAGLEVEDLDFVEIETVLDLFEALE
jgi:acyl carrier protein